MDESTHELLPEIMSSEKRNAIKGITLISLLFILISIILTIIYGIQYSWYLVLCIGIIILLSTTLILGKWYKDGQMIDPDLNLKWILIANGIGLIIIFISLLAIENQPFDSSKCPTCPKCTGCVNSSTTSPCGTTVAEPTSKSLLCYACPNCMDSSSINDTICIYSSEKKIKINKIINFILMIKIYYIKKEKKSKVKA